MACLAKPENGKRGTGNEAPETCLLAVRFFRYASSFIASRLPFPVSRPRLHALEELDRLFARRKPHVSLLPVLAASDEPPHALQLALAVRDPNFRDLHAEERRDGLSDFDLVRVASDLEADRVRRFLQTRRLLGDEGPADDLLRVHHSPPSVATTRDSALFDTTSVP